MHVDKQQTTFRSLADSELDQVSGGGIVLERIGVVLGLAITAGIAAGIAYTDNEEL
jgi:lactobin A/cerein 7B family class IIb bacteriocin